MAIQVEKAEGCFHCKFEKRTKLDEVNSVVKACKIIIILIIAKLESKVG